MNADAQPARARILHVVTGGFSGATQVALDLVRAGADGGRFDVMLALRRKRHTPMDRVAQLREEGLQVALVPGWSHVATVMALRALCRRWQPDLLVAHGFPEHLLARWAGLWAGVPHLVHVEHNSRERYSRWRLWQARRLAVRSDAIVGCSDGVRESLLNLGMPAARTIAIPNGIRIAPFEAATAHPFASRVPGLVMAARFAGQKDHLTLLRGLALLRDRHGMTPPLLLAGGGSARHRDAAVRLCQELGLQGQVQFLGHCATLPQLLMTHRFAVLSTHYEGMPLSLVEGMAAGCAVLGSDVPGVREMLRDGDTGRLVPHEDPGAWAEGLAALLRDTDGAAAMAERGRVEATSRFRHDQMLAAYESLFERLIATERSPSIAASGR
ncbi:glycosyltransferase [Roseateles chitosanitabidus]|uniref:glycosyltransferase n=1 Tax=Roseateles chitosanitabidus TaxID=65048 RepID=UPI000836295E|nr:glycosyltransferase [Roseateles chitosanitabidus]